MNSENEELAKAERWLARIVDGFRPPMETSMDKAATIQTEYDRRGEEIGRLHSWAGLMSLLDEYYPADAFTGTSGDSGPRIVALTRAVDQAVGLLRRISDIYFDEDDSTDRKIKDRDDALDDAITEAREMVEHTAPRFELREQDLRFDVHWPGAAVRITHLPTGHQVTSNSERSQVQNKAKCIRELAERVERASRGGGR